MLTTIIQYQFTRCKNARSKIFLKIGLGISLINKKAINKYFLNNIQLVLNIKYLIKLIHLEKLASFDIHTQGGGLSCQGKTILLGLSRILVQLNSSYKNFLYALGFLTSDLRIKERKKYGLRKARKAPQYSKR